MRKQDQCLAASVQDGGESASLSLHELNPAKYSGDAAYFLLGRLEQRLYWHLVQTILLQSSNAINGLDGGGPFADVEQNPKVEERDCQESIFIATEAERQGLNPPSFKRRIQEIEFGIYEAKRKALRRSESEMNACFRRVLAAVAHLPIAVESVAACETAVREIWNADSSEMLHAMAARSSEPWYPQHQFEDDHPAAALVRTYLEPSRKRLRIALSASANSRQRAWFVAGYRFESGQCPDCVGRFLRGNEVVGVWEAAASCDEQATGESSVPFSSLPADSGRFVAERPTTDDGAEIGPPVDDGIIDDIPFEPRAESDEVAWAVPDSPRQRDVEWTDGEIRLRLLDRILAATRREIGELRPESGWWPEMAFSLQELGIHAPDVLREFQECESLRNKLTADRFRPLLTSIHDQMMTAFGLCPTKAEDTAAQTVEPDEILVVPFSHAGGEITLRLNVTKKTVSRDDGIKELNLMPEQLRILQVLCRQPGTARRAEQLRQANQSYVAIQQSVRAVPLYL